MSERFDVSLETLENRKERESYPKSHGGHMGYRSFFVRTGSGERFVKNHNKDAFTENDREQHSRNYLVKEKAVYDHLSVEAPGIIPESVILIEDHTLVMDAFKPSEGWEWRAPKNQFDRYTDEIIAQLLFLQTIEQHSDDRDIVPISFASHKREGWPSMNDGTEQQIITRIRQFQSRMKPDFQDLSEEMINSLPTLRQDFNSVQDPETYYFSHHDLRQANIAWHPRLGARIIDWSWAGPGRKNSDITTLLIDLHKSGHDVTRYLPHFNSDHAHTLIGFWLAHSLWPTPTNDDTVRLQQVVSAVSAYDLFMKNR
jgi:thiamine kinase-like enzyme